MAACSSSGATTGADDHDAAPVDAGGAIDAPLPRPEAVDAADGASATPPTDAAAPDAGGAIDAGAHDAAPVAHEDAGCVPACAGNTCGPDGCGGTCGACDGEATCQGGACVAPVCASNCGPQEKCGWDPYAHDGTGAFDCIPEAWTTKGCNGVGGIGTCDFGGDLQRCTSTGLVQTVCAAGCGLYASPECGGLAGCITCSSAPQYCGGVDPAPICQGDVRIVCYDNSYDLEWCPATGKTCQCAQGICACQ